MCHGNYTDEDIIALRKSCCGAPQVVMHRPGSVTVAEDKDQAVKPKLPALNASNKE
jgi:hypothetical protein